MLIRQDPIPDLAGRTCEALLAQEYWYRGELVSPANVLYLKVPGEPWHRVYLDYETLFWKREAAPSAPAEREHDGGHRYVLADLGARLGVAGRRIASVEIIDLPGGGEVAVHFAHAPTVVLRHVGDVDELEVRAGDDAPAA